MRLVLSLIMTNFISMWATCMKVYLETGQRQKQKGVYSKKDLAPSGSGREFLLLFIVLHVILRDSGCRIGS